MLLAEAGRVAAALRILLARAGVETGGCDALVAAIERREQEELLKTYGRLASRKRFKIKTGMPLHDGPGIRELFIDESGKAGPGLEPVFALGAVGMTPEAAAAYVAAADELKREFFGTRDVTFHEPHMQRHETVFRFGGDPARQRAFCEALNDVIRNAEFVAFGVAIRKAEFRAFMATGSDTYLPLDVYSVAIHLLLERYLDHLAATAGRHMGRVTFESQGPLEDAQPQMAYTDLLVTGTQWVPDSGFRNWLETGARFVPKAGSHGTELADILSRAIYEWARDGCVATDANQRWAILGEKIHRRGDRRMGKFGIKVFPDSDIRDRIEAQRDSLGSGY